jgi:predicted nucleotidyltransferase
MAETQDPVLEQIVEVLKSEFQPSRLFLFGSRSQGTHKNDSDYDFVVVVPGAAGSRYDNLSKARTLVREKVGVSADVFVYSQDEFDDWKDEFSSIPETALNTGKEIDLG